LAARGLFIFAASGTMTRCSRSTTAGSTFRFDGVGVPAVGWGWRRSAVSADVSVHAAVKTRARETLTMLDHGLRDIDGLLPVDWG